MLKKILILATVFLFLSFNSASFLLASPPAKTMGDDGKVAIITLNRPEVLNAINEPMLPPWVEALEECRTNKTLPR